jgi:hypothetical protein
MSRPANIEPPHRSALELPDNIRAVVIDACWGDRQLAAATGGRPWSSASLGASFVARLNRSLRSLRPRWHAKALPVLLARSSDSVRRYHYTLVVISPGGVRYVYEPPGLGGMAFL